MRKTPLVIIGAVVGFILLVMLCTYVQRPYEAIIVDRFGSIVEPTTLYRGWKICWPTDRISRVDTRSHLFTSNLIETNMKEGRPVNVRLYAAWKIVNPHLFYLKLGTDEKAMDYIRKNLTDRVFTKLTSISMDQIFNENANVIITDQLEADIVTGTKEELEKVGLSVEQIGFSRISFPAGVTESVYQRMTAERRKAAQDENDKAAAESKRILDKAVTERRGILAIADAGAAKVKGEGEQEAQRILRTVINDEESERWFQLVKQSDLLGTISNKWTIILPADSPLLGNVLTVPPSPKGGLRVLPTTQPGQKLPASAEPTLMESGKQANGSN